MATTTVASTGLGCALGVATFSTLGAPINTQLQCALGGQLASSSMLSGVGAFGSLLNENVSFDHSHGWVNGIRAKLSNATSGLAVDARFEALFSDWHMGRGSLETFGENAIDSRAFDNF